MDVHVEALINIDVPDLEAAIEFYHRGTELRLGRRLFEGWPLQMHRSSQVRSTRTGSPEPSRARLIGKNHKLRDRNTKPIGRSKAKMKYHGTCHCGGIAFEVEGEIPEVTSCNCSMCQRKGTLMWFVPRQAMTLLTPPEKMGTYTFNKYVIEHRFCPEDRT